METPQFYPCISRTETQKKSHGRNETRKHYLCTDPDFLKLYSEWTNLRSVGTMKSTVIQDETTTEETHYYTLCWLDRSFSEGFFITIYPSLVAFSALAVLRFGQRSVATPPFAQLSQNEKFILNLISF